MPRLFTGTWEHALLAAVVAEVSTAPQVGYFGRTALQKIVYFLQIAGVPMRYAFDLYHYGPYCDRVSGDGELLVADGVLKDGSPNPERYSDYRPDEGADELIRSRAAELEPHLGKIRAVVQNLLPLEPKRLELLATLDYVYRELRGRGGPGPWAERAVVRFLEVKKDKYPEAQVRAAFDSMAQAGLVER